MLSLSACAGWAPRTAPPKTRRRLLEVQESHPREAEKAETGASHSTATWPSPERLGSQDRPSWRVGPSCEPPSLFVMVTLRRVGVWHVRQECGILISLFPTRTPVINSTVPPHAAAYLCFILLLPEFWIPKSFSYYGFVNLIVFTAVNLYLSVISFLWRS